MNKDTIEFIKNNLLVENLINFPKSFFIMNNLDYNKKNEYVIEWFDSKKGFELFLINEEKKLIGNVSFKIKDSLLKIKKYYIKESYLNKDENINIKPKKYILNLFNIIQKIKKVELNEYDFSCLNIYFSDSCSFNIENKKINDNLSISLLFDNGFKLFRCNINSSDSINHLDRIKRHYENILNKKITDFKEEDFKIISMIEH